MQIQHCSTCGSTGHRATTCDLAAIANDQITLRRIAAMRETVDAMATENSQYESVISVMQLRMSQNKTKMHDTLLAIARLRDGR